MPVPNVQQLTPDDGQRNYPKHAEFCTRINFETSASVGFIEKVICYDIRSHEHMIYDYIHIYRLPTGWTVRGSNPGAARLSAPVQTGPESHPASCTMGTGGKVLPGRDADPSDPSSAEV